MSSRPNIFALCCLLPLLAGRLAAAPVLPAAAAGIANDKLTDALLIKQSFTNSTVQVIVCLAPPTSLKQASFASSDSLAAARPAIRQRQQDVLDALPATDVKAGHRFDNIAGFVADVTPAGLKALQAHAQVISIEPVIELHAHLAQGIPLIGGMTYRSTYNGAGLAIAICDTGVDYTHSKLGGGGFPNSKIIGGYDYGDSDADPMPDSTQAHGTCCAGIAAGDLGTVGDYIGGVAYNAKIYALKITSGTSGSASSAAMASAWDWCVTHKNDNPANPIMVISTSFGGGQYFSSCDSTTPSMTTAANNAVAAGITVFASSGNDGYCDSISWPSCISSVISVGAVYDANFGTYTPCVSSGSCATKIATTGCTSGFYVNDATAADKVTAYANVASFLTLFAPGNDCYTTDIAGAGGYSTGDYDPNFGGTSAACPYAAGAAACLQSAAKALTGSYLSPAEVKIRLLNTGNNVTDTKVAITKPRINIAAAIQTINTNPVVNYASSSLAGGNGNQSADPNECNNLYVVLRNDGVATATNITATLTTATAGATVFQNSSAYPNLAAAATGTNTTAFKIETSPAFVCGTTINLTLVATYNGLATTNNFTLASGGANYSITATAGASIVAGSGDTGNHGDDVVTAIALPFAYTFYGQSFSAATLDSNGNIQFTSAASQYNNACPPTTSVNNAILAQWDDLRTDGNVTTLGTQGIYTNVTGTAPNRIFNIEWRASYYKSNKGGNPLNFEIRLYENQNRFDLIYGSSSNTNGLGATAAAQKDTGSLYAQYSCNTASLTNSLQLTYQSGCTDGGGICSPPVANFTGNLTAGAAPLTITFTNTSTGAASYSWNFGDGKTATNANPANTYTNAGNYTVALTAASALGTNILTRTNYITITNPPPTVTLALTGSPIAEAAGTATVAATLSTTFTLPVTVNLAFSGTATVTNDYTRSATNIIIAPGNLSGSITLTAVQDALNEANETIIVDIATVANGSESGTQQVTAVITDDDPLPSLAISNVSVIEGNSGTTNAVFAITLTPVSGQTVTVNYATANGSATAGSDYTAKSGTLTLAPGLTATNITVTVNGDTLIETNEIFFLNLTSPAATTLVTNQARATILNDDPPIATNDVFTIAEDTALAIAAPGVLANDAAAAGVALTATLTATTTNGTLTFTNNGGFRYQPATNFNGTDSFTYTATDGALTSAVATVTLTITPVNDAPQLPAPPDRTITELTTLTVTNTATDVDLPANFLTYTLLLAPTNAAISTNGVITWTPTEAQGPSTNDFTTVVTDNGIPPLSATNTFAVVVLETNSPPALAPISNAVIMEGSILIFTNTATDADLPTNTLTFSLLAAPPSAVIAAASGVFSWATTLADGPGTNTISIVVTDDGVPALSATQSFTVVVLDTPPPPAVADFSGAPIAGLAPLTVAFTNTSSGADSFIWNFGGGSFSTNAQPENIFTNAGIYTIALTASGAGGTNTLTRTNYIVVTNLLQPVLSVAPAVLYFGRLAPGGTAQAAFVISNAGGSALTGAASGWTAPFATTNDSGFNLSPAEATNLVFTFAPTNAGVFSNAVVFASNGGGSTNVLTGQSLGAVPLRALAWNDAGLRVTFDSVAGFAYELQFKDSLFDTNWQLAGTTAGSGGLLTLTNAAPAEARRFFRLRVP